MESDPGSGATVGARSEKFSDPDVTVALPPLNRGIVSVIVMTLLKLDVGVIVVSGSVTVPVSPADGVLGQVRVKPSNETVADAPLATPQVSDPLISPMEKPFSALSENVRVEVTDSKFVQGAFPVIAKPGSVALVSAVTVAPDPPHPSPPPLKRLVISRFGPSVQGNTPPLGQVVSA